MRRVSFSRAAARFRIAAAIRRTPARGSRSRRRSVSAEGDSPPRRNLVSRSRIESFAI